MAMIGMASQDEEEEPTMFGPKIGTWWVSSTQDARWNKTGRGYGLVTMGGPTDIGHWLTECEQQFGDRPIDLHVGFMKD